MWIRSKRRWIRTEEARGGTGKCWSYVRLRCSILQSLRSIYNLFDFIDFMSRSKRRSGCDRYGEWEALTDAALGFFLELLLTLSDVLSWWGSANQRRRRMIGGPFGFDLKWGSPDPRCGYFKTGFAFDWKLGSPDPDVHISINLVPKRIQRTTFTGGYGQVDLQRKNKIMM
ncbi:hypothetical protein U9M48_028296 [Paspalum notatum var. saurae]|uniref:Uncharacterized protein n=1 Tax=Paspalum notatum var. saurae TaxID=547442 RepID=A0AAQ3TWX3_PASNO